MYCIDIIISKTNSIENSYLTFKSLPFNDGVDIITRFFSEGYYVFAKKTCELLV